MSLCPPLGPGLAGIRPAEAVPGKGLPGVVVALAGQAERRGGGARAHLAGLDRAHHLVLDLDQVGGVEEGPGGEGRIGHRLWMRVQRP